MKNGGIYIIDAKIRGVESATDRLVLMKVDQNGNLYCIICGQQADGTITPIRVDEQGRIILSS